MQTTYRFRHEDVRLPPAQLRHMEVTLDFHPDHVEGGNTLTLVAREPLETLLLDAQELQVLAVERLDGDAATPLRFDLQAAANNLRIELGRAVAAGETFVLRTRCRCVPSETRLEGLYHDTTPAGAPPQIMSQCQQWGFQRILPVIDDCTAKCTFRTTLTADARYTHLISNGNVDPATNPGGRPVPLPGDPARQRITYVNNHPMAPYLFIACVGTWEVLADSVTLPNGRVVGLEYLVPPGRAADARIPMDILKDSVLWQQRTQDYDYPFDVYRTICMEKSDYGGMENVGNTTIITEAALVDAWTSDSRLIYAHGVIIHEYEHNQCGSDVTMRSPFDMWLNEACTVDVERQYCHTLFNGDFMRLREIDAMRAPLVGPLAVEDAGHQGRIVRTGFNHPGELVDGVTYVKAAEVIRMLRLLLGEETFRRALRSYFARYRGGNAATDEFLACFESLSGRDLSAFKREWLHTIGYPQVTVRQRYDAAARRLTVTVEQERQGAGGAFTLPLSLAAVDASGHDIPGTAGVHELDTARREIVFDHVAAAPAFLSVNRDASFYGVCRLADATPEQLRLQVRLDPNSFNRVEAMRELTERERLRLLERMGPDVVDGTLRDAADATPLDPQWLALVRELLLARDLPDGLRGYLLQIDEQPRERRHLPRTVACYRARQILLRAAAQACGEALLPAFEAVDTLEGSRALGLSAAIERRFLKGVLMELLLARDDAAAQQALEEHWRRAWNITDRLNALSALYRSSHPRRLALLEEGFALTAAHLPAYVAYLGIAGRSPHADVFDCVAREARRDGFKLSHPGHARALYLSLAVNNARLWTPPGLAWLSDTVVRMAAVNENTTLRLLACCQQVKAFEPALRERVLTALRDMQTRLPAGKFPSVTGRLAQFLG